MHTIIESLVYQKAQDAYIEQCINEAIQRTIINGLSYFYREDGIIFVSKTALRFAHRIGRYIEENVIEYKLKVSDRDFVQDMNLMQEKLSKLLNVSVGLDINREEKRRRLDNGFFIPKRIADFKIKGVTFRVIYQNLPIGEVTAMSPYDEYGISTICEDVLFEDLDSCISHVMCESIGDDKFETINIYDLAWLIDKGAHLDPEYFEELVNERHLSMLEIRFNNFNFTIHANSTQKEYQDVTSTCVESISDAPTFNLQMKELQSKILSSVTPLSTMFDDTFESKREHKSGLVQTVGNNAEVDGKNVFGFGKEAIKNINNRF